MARKITKRFPRYSLDWLLTGNGSMLASNTDGIVAGRDNSGDNKSNNGDNRGNVTNNYYGECPEGKEQDQKKVMDFRREPHANHGAHNGEQLLQVYSYRFGGKRGFA